LHPATAIKSAQPNTPANLRIGRSCFPFTGSWRTPPARRG
jgi:hypothetical protein